MVIADGDVGWVDFGSPRGSEPAKRRPAVLSGAWSRRIDETNRLVYYVTDDHIVILQARDRY